MGSVPQQPGFKRPDHRGQGVSTLMGDFVNHLEAVAQNHDNYDGLSTGLYDLDDLTGGLQPSNLIVIAGCPLAGKTSLAMNIVESVCLKQGVPVGVFSLRLSAEAIVTRMIASLGDVDLRRIESKQLTDNDWDRVNRTTRLLNEQCELFVDDTPRLSDDDFCQEARRWKRQYDVGLLVVDPLQMMTSSDNKENRTQELSAITRKLKRMAMELHIPVIAISGISSDVAYRRNKRPRLTDIPDSGSIEDDADLITFIYRERIYKPTSKNKERAELIVAKHRNGPLGQVQTRFQPNFARFSDE